MSVKIDLHTHSEASPDGGLTAADYQAFLDQGQLDCIAVTDHNTIDFAKKLQQQLGDKIIVGEEITTAHGEIIGLFLDKAIQPGLSIEETVHRIHAQKGIVYVPHPFEAVRKGIQGKVLDTIAVNVDIVEVYNGRALLENRGNQAVKWAQKYLKPGAASSDAHGKKGWGRTYTIISQLPTRDTLANLLRKGILETKKPTLPAVLYPKFNRVRKGISQNDK